MTNFGNRFKRIITEQPDLDRAAMEATLDKDTNPEDFDVDPLDQDTDNVDDIHSKAVQAVNSHNAAMISKIKGWVDNLDEFVHKLNSQEKDSIQSTLARAEPDTILDKMKQSEQRKIARVATEIAGLAESFRGYLSQYNNPALRGV